MFLRRLVTADVPVCAPLGSKDHDRTAPGRSRDLFVNLGAGGNDTRYHRIALRDIVTHLLVPSQRAADEGDSGVRNRQQIPPYPVLSQDERSNVHLLPLLRIIGKIVGQK